MEGRKTLFQVSIQIAYALIRDERSLEDAEKEKAKWDTHCFPVADHHSKVGLVVIEINGGENIKINLLH